MTKKKNNIINQLNETLNELTVEERLELDASLLAMGFLGLIDEVMEERNISKKDLAKGVGTSPAYITQLFRGNRKPNWSFLAKVQQELDIKFDISTLEKRNEWMRSELMEYHNRWIKSAHLKDAKTREGNYSIMSIEKDQDYALAG